MNIRVFDLLMLIDIRDHFNCVYICDDIHTKPLYTIHDYDSILDIPEKFKNEVISSFYKVDNNYTFII